MPSPWGPMGYPPQYQMPPKYRMPWQQQQSALTAPWAVTTQPSPMTPGNCMPASPYAPFMHQVAVPARPSWGQTTLESVSKWCNKHNLTTDKQAGQCSWQHVRMGGLASPSLHAYLGCLSSEPGLRYQVSPFTVLYLYCLFLYPGLKHSICLFLDAHYLLTLHFWDFCCGYSALIASLHSLISTHKAHWFLDNIILSTVVSVW